MRYFTDFGKYPKPIEAQYTMSGPQNEDQIPDNVKALLAIKGINTVAVIFDHGQGESIQVFRCMKD